MALPFANSPLSGRLPKPNIVLARLLNQLPLFLRSRAPGRGVGPAFAEAELCGLCGRPLRRLSDDEAERKPRNRRTDEGRLLPDTLSVVGVGLKGFLEPGEPGLVLAVATLSVRPRGWAWPLASELLFAWSMGSDGGGSFGEVGCDESGPPPGVGGRPGVAGGDSSGAGMSVPAVRENSMGLISRGMKEGLLVFEGAMLGTGKRQGAVFQKLLGAECEVRPANGVE